MGKNSKSSRKGKKAWRANISTEDIEEHFEKANKDALSGGPLNQLPSHSIFLLDKSKDVNVKRKSDAVSDTGLVDLWDGEGEKNRNKRKRSKHSIIPAVEVDPHGCSFNPDPETHQDSLARAVADEMQKVYRDELGPEPVPLTVPGEVVAEEDMYFLDADNESDDDDQNMDNEKKDGNEENENRSARAVRVTRVEQNKRIRRKDKLKIEAETKKVKQLSREIDSLPNILKEIAREDEEKQKKRIRHAAVKEDRIKSRPPRLGRHKYADAPVQVLLSEELTGSLRKLKGCPTLTKDRFKSLEKRGLVAPTAKTSRK